MSEWWTYRLSDFLMFAPRTYYRLFELQNAAIWPAQIAAIALGLGALWLIWRGTHGRIVAAALGAAWIFVAWTYHWDRYAAINIAAPYYAIGFAAEALLLTWFGVSRDGIRFERRGRAVGYLAYALFIAGVGLYPLLAPLAGRPWEQAEIFGIAPDPTAIATIGALLLARGRIAALLALPLLWCAISALTLRAMDASDAAVPAAAAVIGMSAAIRRWRQARSSVG